MYRGGTRNTKRKTRGEFVGRICLLIDNLDKSHATESCVNVPPGSNHPLTLGYRHTRKTPRAMTGKTRKGKEIGEILLVLH